jgi:hypothetical protein
MLKTIVIAGAALAAGLAAPGAAAASSPGWTSGVAFTNQVASSPTTGGGYPVPPGQTFPNPGTCREGSLNSNHSESWIAVKPGTEDLIGNSKFFFDKYSKFYIFSLGTIRFLGGTPVDNNQVQGYDCISTGTQAMPPSWTDVTDPNVAFDTKGRAYQTTLPFNAFWGKSTLHPDGAIDVSYSDDMGQHWVKGNGGKDLEQSPNSSARQAGHVEDKQWIAVNDIPGSPNQNHVYAMWSVFNSSTTKIRIAVSRDRGRTFSKAVTVTAPSQTGPSNTFIYPSIDAAGTLPPRRRPRRCMSATPATTAGPSPGSSRPLRPRRCRAAACRTPPSATGSPRTSPPARPTPGISTSPMRTGTAPRWTSSSLSPPTAAPPGRPR